jgi:glycine/D-amino acid oxidase-like deaminating enzyme
MDDAAMQNDWLAKVASGGLAPFCDSAELYPLQNENLLNPFGCLGFTKGGYVDTAVFLETFRKVFLANRELIEVGEVIGPSEINIHSDHVEIGGFKAKEFIDCSGFFADSFYGMALPFKLVKGEIITVRIPNLNLEPILMKGVFIVPLGNDLYRVGATYDWELSNLSPTTEGKTKLSDELKKITLLPFEVIDHMAGIRPASKDRRPVIGKLPLKNDHHSAYIFNGFGTKGISLIPYYADHFIDHLLNSALLEHEVDIGRFCYLKQ